MQDLLPGRTAWETREYAADHGRAAAIAIGYQLLARHISACAAEDAELLGLTALPDPRPQTWPVTVGTDEERKARIDAWAARHGVTASTDETSGHYKAVLKYGPVWLEVYMVPDQIMADQVQHVKDRLTAIHAAVSETRKAVA